MSRLAGHRSDAAAAIEGLAEQAYRGGTHDRWLAQVSRCAMGDRSGRFEGVERECGALESEGVGLRWI